MHARGKQDVAQGKMQPGTQRELRREGEKQSRQIGDNRR
jgi:hypothetical protein